VASIERRAAHHPGLFLIGSGYHGVGIPDCIADGARVTQAILSVADINSAVYIKEPV
jgi:oxygen-dependent protoporphyrinogen oxidase